MAAVHSKKARFIQARTRANQPRVAYIVRMSESSRSGTRRPFRLATGIGGAVAIGTWCRPVLQRWQCLGFFQIDAHTLGQAAAVIFVAMPEVPDHAQLDVFRALLEVVGDIGDQVLAFPILERAVALTRLLVVAARASGLVAAQMPFDPLVIVTGRLGRLAQAVLRAGLVVDVGV